jgi:tetratricopeptide (TPR) repeat protein
MSNDLPEEFNNRINAIADRVRATPRLTQPDHWLAYQQYADVLRDFYRNQKLSVSESDIEAQAHEAVKTLFCNEMALRHLREMSDESMAERFANLLGMSNQDHPREIKQISEDIEALDPNDPLFTEPEARVLASRLATRACCLEKIGAYDAAIMDCAKGIELLRWSTNILYPMLAVTMTLEATLASSFLKSGDLDSFKPQLNRALKACTLVFDAEPGSDTTGLADAMKTDLTTLKSLYGIARTQPIETLSHSEKLLSLSPGSLHALGSYLGALCRAHKYRQASCGFERWVESAIELESKYNDGLKSFTPRPDTPLALFSEADETCHDEEKENSKTGHHEFREAASRLPLVMVCPYLLSLLMQGRVDEAKALYAEVLRKAKDFGKPAQDELRAVLAFLSAVEKRLEGDRVYDSGDFLLASEIYSPIARGFENSTEGSHRLFLSTLHYKLGLCRKKTSDFSKAIECFSASLKIVPDNMEALQSRAWCYVQSKKLLQAMQDYQSFIHKYLGHQREPKFYETVSGFKYPSNVSESSYQTVKSNLQSLKDERNKARCNVPQRSGGGNVVEKHQAIDFLLSIPENAGDGNDPYVNHVLPEHSEWIHQAGRVNHGM